MLFKPGIHLDLLPLPHAGEGWGEGKSATRHYTNHSCSRYIYKGYSPKLPNFQRKLTQKNCPPREGGNPENKELKHSPIHNRSSNNTQTRSRRQANQPSRPADNNTRSISFTRVCQPSPVARSAANTSASNRNVATCFASRFRNPTGLPRLLPATLATHLCRVTSLGSIIGMAVSNHCLLSDGASPGSTQSLFKVIDFASMCVPHRNDADCRTARSPNQYSPSTVQHPIADKTCLVVVKTLIAFDQPLLTKNLVLLAKPGNYITQRGSAMKAFF